ncbi:hypothetical protein PAT3040_02415 [Paenibacillus agaridevorans]|uniref:DUF3600 domain-containing protein n=1 Tax=Paenibacillus agaridevorans TaxID=171404 RepID=A0A2R5EMI2_9BACL|nr:DUF3600 domain-containing protein [Paenibacillus agaridevorans]GBG07852.1 hypothetical protein PAT3040_02415 [Paenibacillus agaridevorans]
MKKWLIAGVLSAVLLIPTGAYAGYTYWADTIYGSKKQAEGIGLNAQRYEDLERRLAETKQSLAPEDFEEFMLLLQNLGGLVLKYGSDGEAPTPEQLSDADYESYLHWTSRLEPLLAKLSEAEASRDAEERNQFADELLAMAEKKLDGEELSAFVQLVQAMQKYEAKVSDSDGSLHMERLSPAEQKELSRLREEIQPYFEKLGIETARNHS